MRDEWEILADDAMGNKGRNFIRAMSDAAPQGSETVKSYSGKRRFLMVYGPGSPGRLPIIKNHIQAGGRVAMWDLGYWDRKGGMRLAIDTLHPTPEQIAMSPTEGRRGFSLRTDANPLGPILLIGVGPKSVYAYGLGRAQAWEMSKIADLRRRFPGREILWRPKGRYAIPLDRLRMVHGMPIEDAMAGCSLVVCRHSNVAVDACVAGIPVECDGGAALALYAGNPNPTPEQRLDFLNRLTWWEWSRPEAAQAWQWIEKVVH